jgi:hypothetical protein
MCASSNYRKASGFVARAIAGEAILVPVRASAGEIDAIFNLDEVGAFIWSLLNGETAEAQIVEAVSAEFEVDSELAAADIRRFLDSLETAGIVEKGRG